MEDEKKTESNSEELNEVDFEESKKVDDNTDNADEKSENANEEEVEKSIENSEKAKKDAHFAQLRRKKEAEEREAREKKIREEATLKAKLGMVKTNPYTDEPIIDEEDLEIYEIQKELDDEGKDPNNDLGKRLAEINRKKKADSLAKAKADEESKQKINDEVKELVAKYPKLNTAELSNDPLFKELSEGKLGRWNLTEIYEYYLDKKAKRTADNVDNKKKETVEKNSERMSKTPSSSTSGRTSPKSINDMTDEEFRAYWNSKYN